MKHLAQPPPLFAYFDGPSLTAADQHRLGRQFCAVQSLMRDGRWRTLAEIERATGHPQASVSARLRDMRKVKFGALDVRRRRRVDGGGTWEYCVCGGGDE